MSEASTLAAYLALIWAAVLAWLALGAMLRRAGLQRRFRGLSSVPARGRRVLLLRPCAGDEPGLLANLLSVRELDTSAELRLVMSVDDPSDRARPVIEAAIEELRAAGIDARCEVLPPTGPNRKASMLAALLAQHGRGFEWVVNVDSNVDLSGFPLDELLAPLLDETGRVGASWSPWSEQRSFPGLGPRASEAVLGASLTAFPLLCALYSYGLVGKIWAARREALDECDFATLSHYLGEDLEMARRLRARGWAIVAPPLLGRARGGNPSFSQVVARFGRWILAARKQRPELLLSYPLFFFATPMVLGLAALGLASQPTLALSAAALAVGARLVVTMTAQFWSGRRVGPLRALVEAGLGDLALGLAWLLALRTREVEWRGHRLRVGSSGKLSSADGS